MSESSEDEIYSTMFSSLKHPVRRKILRMLGNKPMTFMEMVDELGVSSSHLTYHLESLGELVSKQDSGQYKLSAFGVATIGAMKGVEDIHEAEPKRKQVTSKWKMASVALLIATIAVSALAGIAINSYMQIYNTQQDLIDQNHRLLSYGMGADKVANFLENVTKINVSNYTLFSGNQGDNQLTWRNDFGGVTEENVHYSLSSTYSNLRVDLRYRNNHFNRYTLTMVESAPIFTQLQPTDVLQNAKYTLARYKAYAGDSYLTNMSNILNSIGMLSETSVTQGNIKLNINITLSTVTFTWMYTVDGEDFQTKGVKMIFQNNILTEMSDGFYLFTIGSTQLSVSREEAIEIAKDYIKSMSYQIGGQTVSGFSTLEEPLRVPDFAAHNRGNSVALYPYWYVQFRLTQTYAGGINEVSVGIWGDTGQIADRQLLVDGVPVAG
jgi:hypothetical protein